LDLVYNGLPNLPYPHTMEACPVFLKDFVTDETSEESDILSDNGEYLD